MKSQNFTQVIQIWFKDKNGYILNATLQANSPTSKTYFVKIYTNVCGVEACNYSLKPTHANLYSTYKRFIFSTQTSSPLLTAVPLNYSVRLFF